jgi:hypothetical protein
VEQASTKINNELRNRAYNAIKKWRNDIDPFNGLTLQSDNLITGKLTILRRSIDDVKQHNAEWRDLLYLPRLDKKIKDWEYMGFEKIKHPKSKANIILFYKAKIGNKERFIEVLLHQHFSETLYCIAPFDNRDLIENKP